ncbi:MAG: DUF1287 domain-containing protein [Elusimicrobia bacterium]|nr:DUF1287 domain-containing protein [Elusimicrobiota bacterium]
MIRISTRRALLSGVATFCLALPLAAFVGRSRFYRGPAVEPVAWNPAVSRDAIVAEARKLVGVWYDPVQGGFGNLGGRLGLIVCMDVPVIAYRNAGTSIRRLLEADYRAHPGRYSSRDGSPRDPYFDRRARNLHTYCRENGCLDLAGPPKPADVVFLSRGETAPITHIVLVSGVEPSGRYSVIEASRDEWYVTREEPGEAVFRRGWTFRGFGRPLSRSTPQ